MTQVDGDQAEFEMKMEGTYMVAAGNITRGFKIVIIIICGETMFLKKHNDNIFNDVVHVDKTL